MIGIHHSAVENRDSRPADDELGPAFEIRIGFETHLPLPAEAARLRAAGLDLELLADEAAPRIVLDRSRRRRGADPPGPVSSRRREVWLADVMTSTDEITR